MYFLYLVYICAYISFRIIFQSSNMNITFNNL